MELSKLFMIAAVTKNSYDQCRAILIDNDKLDDNLFLLICEYSLALAKTFEYLEELIIDYEEESNQFVKVDNKKYLKQMVAKCARLEDRISEKISLTIH